MKVISIGGFVWCFFLLQSQEVEETLKRISSHKGVVGTIVVNSEGMMPIFDGLKTISKQFSQQNYFEIHSFDMHTQMSSNRITFID